MFACLHFQLTLRFGALKNDLMSVFLFSVILSGQKHQKSNCCLNKLGS